MNKEETIENMTNFLLNRNHSRALSLSNISEEDAESLLNDATRMIFRGMSEDLYDAMDEQGLIVKD
jgi:phage terminase large subunit-like protein